MRTIKFRAAHYTYEEVFDGFSYWGRINNKYESIDDYSMFMSPSSWSGSIIKAEEQFTGLLDKNGKEIYENDLLQYKGAIFKVFWSDEKARFSSITKNVWNKTSDTYFYKSIEWASKKCEVIGNIHENTELT